MISLLISILILLLFAGILYYIVTLLPLPAPFKNIALIILLLIVLLVLLMKLLPLVGVSYG